VLVLSFRDMSTSRCSAVTSAAMYWLRPVDAKTPWSPAPGGRLTLATWDETAAALRNKHVCFLVHGFNVDRDGGYTGLGALAQEMTGLGPLPKLKPASLAADLSTAGVDVIVPVLWAGDWYLPINYPFLLPDIRVTADHFADLIWSAATQMRRVSFVTHSMGARVVMETVQRVVAKAAGKAIPAFDTAVFTAGAIPDDCLDLPDFADAVDAFRQVVVVSSASDTVLSGDFPAGNAVEQALWANDHGSDRALGCDGPSIKADSKARSKTTWYPIPRTDFQRHNDYLPSPLDPHPTAGYVNGWNDKRVRIGKLAKAALEGSPAPLPASPIP
jgi:enamine deaminase RidA (YjgF/YER057c/UK114 family)